MGVVHLKWLRKLFNCVKCIEIRRDERRFGLGGIIASYQALSHINVTSCKDE